MKHILTILLTLSLTLPLMAQKQNSPHTQAYYHQKWDALDTLLRKDAYQSAYDQAQALFLTAQEEHNSRALLTTAVYLSRIEFAYREEAEDSAHTRYQTILPLLDTVDQALCHLFLAQYYHNYKQRNSYILLHNQKTDEPDLHHSLWSLSQYDTAIQQHLQQTFAHPQLLQATPVSTLSHLALPAATTGSNSTPTLFDLCAVTAQELTPEPLFRIQLQQQRMALHQNDADDIRIQLDLEWANLLEALPAHLHSQDLPIPTPPYLQTLIAQYPHTTCPLLSDLYHIQATLMQASPAIYPLPQVVEVCRQGYALFPKSAGGADCYNLLQRITAPAVDNLHIALPPIGGKPAIATTTVRNVDTLYFRIIAHTSLEKIPYQQYAPYLAARPVLQSWQQATPTRTDHTAQTLYNYLPAMPSGHYMLLVSPTSDFTRQGIGYVDITYADATFLEVDGEENHIVYHLLETTTGTPIANQKVELWQTRNQKEKLIATQSTDATGRVRFPLPDEKDHYYRRYLLRTQYHGLTIEEDATFRRHSHTSTTAHHLLYTDRPIYKPGEEVSVALLSYEGDGTTTGHVLPDISGTLSLYDPNHALQDSITLTTDAHGMAHARLHIPAEALPGSWSLELQSPQGHAYKSIQVEYYKQPKFAIAMEAPATEAHFGTPLTLTGNAISYTAVPVSKAHVSYRITRTRLMPVWHFFWFRPTPAEAPVEMAHGESTTDDLGGFAITFTPTPDSAVSPTDDPIFQYTVEIIVTDLNGESHEAQSTLLIGYRNALLNLSLPATTATWESLSYTYKSLNGIPLQGSVTICVEELQPPTQALLEIPTEEDTAPQHTLSPEEFAHRYPHLAYDPTSLQPHYYPVKRQVLRQTHTAGEEVNTFALPALPAGCYRVTLTAVTPAGDTLTTTSETEVVPPTAKRIAQPELLWHTLNSTTLQVGDTLTLRIGSRFRHQPVHVAIGIGDSLLQVQRLTLNDDIQTLRIPVTEAMRGGFSLSLFTLREGEAVYKSEHITVPYSNKQLSLYLETFRDKLQPGATETWQLRTEKDGTGIASHLLLTMYDAALDTYNDLGWNLSPWHSHGAHDYLRYSFPSFWLQSHWKAPQWLQGNTTYPYRWELKEGSFTHYGYVLGRTHFTRMYKSASVQANYMATEAEEESAMVSYDLVAADAEEDTKSAPMAAPEAPVEAPTESPAPVILRENLSTLAFFEPCLHSDNSGRYTLTFTVPELLTRWHIQGLALTDALETGSLTAFATTAKELMVVPNVPRFLRQGDCMDFAVKVTNHSDSLQQVTVSLEMLDAATHRALPITAIGEEPYAGKASTLITIEPHSSCPVTFRLQVPVGEIFAITYRVVAQGQHSSDGEQAVIPVLPNRTLVTESLSMYINGKGEKHYTFAHLAESPSTTRQNHAFVAECTANPLWYAVQALPYVEEQENPGNLYLAHSIYSHALGSHLLHTIPGAEDTFQHWAQEEPDALLSKLEQNEDVKQTILQETPWLRDGTQETERMRRVALFFDQNRLEKSLKEATEKLEKRQCSSGAWCWMPDSRWESEWVTNSILRTFGRLHLLTGDNYTGAPYRKGSPNTMLRKALQYVDNENYKYYQECIKHPQCTPANINYLYTRSFFKEEPLSKEHKAAFDFFYSNAKKHYRTLNGLYTQAQLAIIFHRYGDSRMAQDIIRRLKERSLTHDEMGMYWRDNIGGYLWNERPIEVQSLIIEAFREVTPTDSTSIALMQQWLLKQKQTTGWDSEVATMNAIHALVSGTPAAAWDGQQVQSLTLSVGGTPLSSTKQSGADYQRQQWPADSITPAFAHLSLQKSTDGIAWAAAYWQYFEDLDKVPYSEMGVKLQKTIYRMNPNGEMSAVNGTILLHVGDKVRVRILIDCDRNLEYLQLKDARPSAFEPLTTHSGWHWNNGLGYYTAVYNAATIFYIDRLEKGKYILTYDLLVTASGSKLTVGSATMQCLYAPEFRCTTQGIAIQIKE